MIICLSDITTVNIGSVSITAQSSGTSGKIFSISCSAEIVIKSDSPYPNFEWFFGPSNNSLPSNVAVLAVTRTGITYTSTLQFSPLLQSHAGMYTCRLGGNERLAEKTTVTVLACKLSFTASYRLQYNLICCSNHPSCGHRQWEPTNSGTKLQN